MPRRSVKKKIKLIFNTIFLNARGVERVKLFINKLLNCYSSIAYANHRLFLVRKSTQEQYHYHDTGQYHFTKEIMRWISLENK